MSIAAIISMVAERLLISSGKPTGFWSLLERLLEKLLFKLSVQDNAEDVGRDG